MLARFQYTMSCKKIVQGGQAAKTHFNKCLKCLKICLTNNHERYAETDAARSRMTIAVCEIAAQREQLKTELGHAEASLICSQTENQALREQLKTARVDEHRVAITIKTAADLRVAHYQDELIRELRAHKDEMCKLVADNENLSSKLAHMPASRKRRRIILDDDIDDDETETDDEMWN